jgi:hypothetical protein
MSAPREYVIVRTRATGENDGYVMHKGRKDAKMKFTSKERAHMAAEKMSEPGIIFTVVRYR